MLLSDVFEWIDWVLEVWEVWFFFVENGGVGFVSVVGGSDGDGGNVFLGILCVGVGM